MKYFRLFLWIIGLTVIFSCTTNNVANAQGMDFRILASGSYGGISTKSHQLVSDENTYKKISAELYKNVFPAPSLVYSPDKSYIFITFGQKNSGGLDYEITKVTSSGNKIQVYLKSLHKNVKSGEMNVTMAIANPYIIIEINKTQSKEVELIQE